MTRDPIRSHIAEVPLLIQESIRQTRQAGKKYGRENSGWYDARPYSQARFETTFHQVVQFEQMCRIRLWNRARIPSIVPSPCLRILRVLGFITPIKSAKSSQFCHVHRGTCGNCLN